MVAKTHEQLKQEFLTFHRANPLVYACYLRLIRKAMRLGKKKIGIGAVTEVIRWEIFLKTDSNDGFKINNNHRAFYTRKLVHDYPDLKDVITRRKRKSVKAERRRTRT